MVNIKTIKNIKLGSKITLVNGIYAILIGIFYLTFSNFILKINFESMGIAWGFFERYNAEISALFGRLFILVGLIVIAIGAGIIYLSYCIIKEKEKDLWIVLFFIGIVFWSGLFIIEALNQNWYTIGMTLVGWVSFIIGMMIPIRYYIEKPYKSY